MKITDLLRTPRPRSVFALTHQAVIYGFLDGKRSGLERLESRAVAADCFQVGPVGLLQVKVERLKATLESLKASLGEWPKKASLVVPDAWLRTVLLELEALPRRREEAEEVIRWRLKKLLPCRPEEVRLDYVPSMTNSRVLVAFGLDKPLSLLEEAFASMGCHLGSLEPVSVAVAAVLPSNSRPFLLFSTFDAAMAAVVVAAGQVQLTRLKLLPNGEAKMHAMVLRELTRTVQLLGQYRLAEAGFSVVIGECSEGLAQAVQLWALEQRGVDVRRLGHPPGVPQGSVSPLLTWGLVAACQPGEGR
ncbi:MAG: hypothetical protein ACUVRY_08605 [Thermoanaerobaculaceae bacterium]